VLVLLAGFGLGAFFPLQPAALQVYDRMQDQGYIYVSMPTPHSGVNGTHKRRLRNRWKLFSQTRRECNTRQL